MMEPENPTHTYHDVSIINVVCVCNKKFIFFQKKNISSHFQDCYDRMKNFVKGHAMLVGGIGIGIACILIIGMVLSMALFCMID